MEKVTKIKTQAYLVKAIKTNNSAVLKKLYQDNFKKIELFVLKNSGSRPQAKDLYQEAFLACYQNIKLNKFAPTGETALEGYLFTIAKNKWTDYLRSSRYKNTLPLQPEMIKDDASDYDIHEESIAIENLKTQTATAFQQLGAECKKMLEVFYFDKKSLREIAIQFGIGEASARNKKYRCIQKLRTLTAPKP